jgi:uncharacterized membrane protein YhhN
MNKVLAILAAAVIIYCLTVGQMVYTATYAYLDIKNSQAMELLFGRTK